MSHYISQVTTSLENIITELSENPSLFLKNPETDFTRNRKIDFKTLVGITMNSGGATMSKELLDYFDFKASTPTVSAYTQQRGKVLPDAFEFIFHSFTETNIPSNNTFNGYRLIACDGSNLTIATNKNDSETMWKCNQFGDISNKNDSETMWKCNQFGDISNHLHLNAFYDVLNRVYLDAIVQTVAEFNEYQAAINMAERSNFKDVIFVADRGYENYNLMAHLINNDWKFLIRVKDKNSNGIVSALKIDLKDEFDKDLSITFTRKQTKVTRSAGYKFMPANQRFDYLPLKSNDTYTINFRIARFPIGENSYETVVTNLDRFNFPVESLKDIYHLRWGIETSFRELKYSVGLTSFHAKKVDYIKQEIFARLTLYNYCELITSHVVNQMKDKGNTKQVNYTIAIYICREFLRHKKQLSPPDVIKLIKKYILPVRIGRKDPRKVKTQSAVSFLYRVA